MTLAPQSRQEKRLWSWAVTCLLAIYCSVPVVRPVANFLRDRNLLRMSVAITFAIAVAWILWILLSNRPGKHELLVLGGLGLVYVFVLSRLPLPEERIHYLEYGLLAGFLYSALLERRIQRLDTSAAGSGLITTWALGPALGAVSLNALLGWVDEGIQALIPDRHYDFRDVMMNSLAGIIAVVAIIALRQARRWDQKVEGA